MLNRACQHIGDGLDPTMGMPREPFLEIGGVFVAKIVKQQERIKFGWVVKAKGTVQMHPCPFQRGLCTARFDNRTDRHKLSPSHAP